MKPPAPLDFRALYDRFDVPLAPLDCGAQCAPHNPSGKPFCCDICHAVPAAYKLEWAYLRQSTALWHVWRGDECTSHPEDPAGLLADTAESMLLLACAGPDHCQRPYRALSCRQFPFFPYIDTRGQFIGLAYEWVFEEVCWVISNLAVVTAAYRQEFISAYETLFATWPAEFESYAIQSADMRAAYLEERRRIPLLHRRGGYYLLSPGSERLRRIAPEKLPRFGPYQE